MTARNRLTICVALGLAMVSLELSVCRAQQTEVERQIEIEAQFVEFSISDIAGISQKGIVEAESLRVLQEKGKGNLLFAPKVMIHSGMEACVKSVTEYIYPTELKVYPSIGNNTNAIVQTGELVVAPANFETREVGVILSVLPEASLDGRVINLTMAPKVVFEPDWKKYSIMCTDAQGKEHEGHIEQPFFHTRAVNTSVALANGATVLVGGGMPSKDKDKMLYVFVTARLVDMNGKPINTEDLSNQ